MIAKNFIFLNSSKPAPNPASLVRDHRLLVPPAHHRITKFYRRAPAYVILANKMTALREFVRVS